MLAVVSLALFMAVDGAAPAKDVDTYSRELEQVIEQARRDFEARHAELGLLGAAPLAGKERAQPLSDEIPSKGAAFDGAAQAPAAPAAAPRSGGSH